MLQGTKKSTGVRRIAKKTPGARVVLHYELKGPNKAVCAKCGALLHGVASMRPYFMKKLSKTEKRPSRPYGGMLCSVCMRELQKEKARN